MMMDGGSCTRKPPSLVDLCVNVAIENIRYLGDVGETDLDLLGRILTHCTLDQLKHIEKSTLGRDLSPVTDMLWKRFYQQNFGEESLNHVVENMKRRKVAFRWSQLYEAKEKEIAEREVNMSARLKQLYKKEDSRRQSRQVQLCTKVPPSSSRRSFGGGYNFSNVKSNIMKKSKLEFLQSLEVKNLAAMKKSVQRNNSSSSIVRPGSFAGKSSAPSSNPAKFAGRRF